MGSNAFIRDVWRLDVVNLLDIWCEQNKIAILTEVNVRNNTDAVVSIKDCPRLWQLSERRLVGAFPW